MEGNMTTTNWIAPGGGAWTDAANWDNGVPISGDTVNIDTGTTPTISIISYDTLGLSKMSVFIGADDELRGNALSLANTSITGSEVSAQSLLVIGKGSTVPRFIDGGSITNNSTISPVIISATSFLNNGTINAANGPKVSIAGATVTGPGAINVKNGGELELADSAKLNGTGKISLSPGSHLTLDPHTGASIGSSQLLDFGGKDAAILTFDAGGGGGGGSSSGGVQAVLSRFASTDVIHITDFTPQGAVTQSGTLNPTLTFIGSAPENPNNPPASFTLNFQGNFAKQAFTTTSDGTDGIFLSVNHT
jgi:hypothetical protein